MLPRVLAPLTVNEITPTEHAFQFVGLKKESYLPSQATGGKRNWEVHTRLSCLVSRISFLDSGFFGYAAQMKFALPVLQIARYATAEKRDTRNEIRET